MSPRSSVALKAVALVLLTVGAYAPTFTATYVYEDRSAVVETAGTPIAWTKARALTRASYAVDRYFGGGTPWMSHLTNVGLHIINSAIIFLLVSTLWPAGAWIAIFFFALHPLQSETVAYAAGRNELLSTTLCLLAAWLWLRARSSRRLLLITPVLLAAVSAKESAICLLAILALASGMRLAPRPSTKLLAALSVCALTLGLLAWLMIRPEFQIRAAVGRLQFASWQSLALWWSVGSAVGLMPQSVDRAIEQLPRWYGYVSLYATALAVGALGLYTVLLHDLAGWTRRNRLVVFGLWWAVAALALRFVMRIPEVLNEHQLYLAMAGVALACGGCAKEPTDVDSR